MLQVAGEDFRIALSAMSLMDAAQCRAARALMGWSANELAHRSGVSLATVRRFETGLSAPMPANLKAMREAFERAGVEFIEGGVRRR